MSQPIQILIADDHKMVREGLSQICDAEPDMQVIAQAADGQTACRLAILLRPDVVIMDINMPIMDGVQAAHHIAAIDPAIKIIILTMYRQDQYIFEAIKAGARAYLLKDDGSEELLRTIRQVAAGEVLLDQPIAQKMMEAFHLLKNDPAFADTLTPLEELELDILRLIAQGLTNGEIGDRLSLSEKTVRNRLTVIFDKLQVNNRTQAAIYVLKQGLDQFN